MPANPPSRRVALLTLGCARNEVDSEELAARLDAGGWQVGTDAEAADVVLVNTCGFVEKAKQDSIETLLAAADTGAKVVAAGCMAERYGRELADSLPEAEAEWLARTGVRELVLVSENSTSYGKDLGDPRLLEKLLPQLAAVNGIVRVRASYLQPAETRPGLVETIATTPGVAAYFDLSFQHSSEPVLRRMRRFGSTERFLQLLDSVRALDPEAGARSNFIVGFPGETRGDVDELVRFLTGARLDAVGVFDYSDEDGTEAAGMSGKVREDTIKRRYGRISALADELCAQRAEDRLGSTIEVLVDTVDGDEIEGRAAHQAPEVDGSTTLIAADAGVDLAALRPGDFVRARVTATEGVDLVAVPVEMISANAKRSP